VNRHYAQNVGRFNRVDPVAPPCTLTQVMNRYSYAGNDPINAFDPDGRVTVCSIVATGKIWLSMGGDGWALIGTFIVTRCEDIGPLTDDSGGGGGGGGKKTAADCRKDLEAVKKLWTKALAAWNAITRDWFLSYPDEASAFFEDFGKALDVAKSVFNEGIADRKFRREAREAFQEVADRLIRLLKSRNLWFPNAVQQTVPISQQSLQEFSGPAKKLGQECKGVAGLTPEEERAIESLSSEGNEFVYGALYDRLLSVAKGGN
jgi:hypothetical protein